MKKSILICLIGLFSIALLKGQETPTLPIASLIDMEGKAIPEDAFNNGDAPVIISFWATWCAPCLKELESISALYGDWQKESGVKLIAISIDRIRQLERVKTLVKDKSWAYQVYMDQSGDFRSALNVVNIPHTFVLNGKGEIVYQSTTYATGDELKLYEKVKAIGVAP